MLDRCIYYLIEYQLQISNSTDAEVRVSPQDQIINLLNEYQKRNSLNDEQMAARLGIAPSSWNLFKRGKRDLPKPGILGGFARLCSRRLRLLGEFLSGDEEPEENGEAA